MNEPNVQTISQMVRKRFEGLHPSGLTIEVLDDGIRKMDTWWQVPVRPNTWPAKTFELYDALAEVEIELQEQEHLNILLSLMAPLEKQVA